MRRAGLGPVVDAAICTTPTSTVQAMKLAVEYCAP
jgi:hypothetical protein